MKQYLTPRACIGLALLAVCALAALAGHPLLPDFAIDPDHLASGSLALPFIVGNTAEIKTLIEQQGRAWEEFKRKNDERIEAIEKKGFAPADLVETVAKLNAELNEIQKKAETEAKHVDELEKKLNRPGGGGGGDGTPDQIEHKSAFRQHLRKGGDIDRDLEKKALRRNSDPDGGYLVDYELDAQIDRVASVISGMRGIAMVRAVGKSGYKKRVKTSGMAGRWVEEGETGGETTNPKFSLIEIDAYKMEAEPWATNEQLEDADFDLEGDIAAEAGITFGETEGAAFITGNGVKKPRGILAYPIVANDSYAWGKVGYIASGAAGDFAASNPGDKLIDLQHALKAQYRPGARWLVGDTTLAKIRQMKDGSGNYYLWNPDPSAGFGGVILGSPVTIDDNMPVVAANSYSLAYGNFQRGYVIVDRRGTALIRDNITAKGYTKFNFTRRVGGGIVQFEAIKVMKFAAS